MLARPLWEEENNLTVHAVGRRQKNQEALKYVIMLSIKPFPLREMLSNDAMWLPGWLYLGLNL